MTDDRLIVLPPLTDVELHRICHALRTCNVEETDEEERDYDELADRLERAGEGS